jgi:hypothetical protein
MEMESLAPEETLSIDEVNELEERRLSTLNEAGIDEEEVLERSLKNKNIWNSYFNENITRGKDDLNFCVRDQWTAVERSEFSRLFKPCFTANKIYDSTKKIVGEQRKNKPDLLVRSLTGKATQEQINLRADLVRTISYQSQNDIVYQTAFRSALMMGFGGFRIGMEYESARSFKKVIRYYPINDITMCSFDPTAIKPHKGDGNNCSHVYTLSEDEFYATYPYITNPISYVDPNTMLDQQWKANKNITLCEEWVKEWYPLIIYRLSNGETVTKDEWEAREKGFEDNREFVKDSIVGKIIAREIPTIIGERQTQDYRIMQYRMLKNQIVDFMEWPSKYLPIVFVDGNSEYMDGKQYTKSFIRDSRDSQKLLNYSISELACELKNRRREQWMGTPDNIIGNEQQWRNPELQQGILVAKADPKSGAMPSKMPAWEVSQGLFATMQSATQNIREILGFSENEEMQGRDVSGKARRERKMEGSMSAYVFLDNLNQSIEQGGRASLDLLPYVMGDEERNVTISKKDGRSESIVLNEKQDNGTIKNAMDKGEYDVEIDTGPSFAVQKDIALEFFQQTISNNPQVFNLIADLWASNLDIQQMDQVKKRLKTLVPPQILAEEEGKQLPPQPPSPQEQMMKMEMELKQAEIQSKKDALQIKAQELQLKKEAQQLEEAELMLKAQKIQTDTELNVYDHQANIEKARITHEMDKQKTHLDFSHKIASILADIHKHENPQEKKEKKESKAA